MSLKQTIKILCDGDANIFRDIIPVNKINDWYWVDFERQKESFFKKYRKQCKLASERMK